MLQRLTSYAMELGNGLVLLHGKAAFSQQHIVFDSIDHTTAGSVNDPLNGSNDESLGGTRLCCTFSCFRYRVSRAMLSLHGVSSYTGAAHSDELACNALFAWRF